MKKLLFILSLLISTVAHALPGEEAGWQYIYYPNWWIAGGTGWCGAETPEAARVKCQRPIEEGWIRVLVNQSMSADGWWYNWNFYVALAPDGAPYAGEYYYAQGGCAPGWYGLWNNELNPPQQGCRRKLPTCDKGQFLGPVSFNCRTLCPPDEYLLDKSGFPGLCKAKPKGVTPTDVDPDAGQPDKCTGNPINTATGNKFQREVDSNSGAGIPFTRSYNSVGKRLDSGLGLGWQHNWSARIVPVIGSDKPADVDADDLNHWPGDATPRLLFYRIERADGASVSVDPDGNLVDASNKFSLQFSKAADGFTLFDGLVTERYDLTGKLISLQEAGGRSYTLAYNGDLLATVTDTTTGRTLQFTYESASSNRLVRVDAGSQLVASFQYDAKGLLSQVSHADSTSRQYLYDDANAPGKLSGIMDEANVRYATWAYDTAGRAIRSEHAGGVDRYTLSFGSDATGTTWSDETGPLGATRRFSFSQLGQRILTTGNTQPATSGCQAGISQYGYDALGNMTSKQDLAGTRTTYEYDQARKLETTRTEAAGTTLARTVTTTWHPTFALPATITEPGKATANVYDGNGNLTSRTVTDTATQQSRTWLYSYDSGNRLLSATAPGNLITRYSYDSQGNLATVTDPAGLVTRYTQYDANGLPLTISQPSGTYSSVTIKLQYDGRGRLTQRTVGTDITVYTYTVTGLLQSVTLPSGTSLRYDYDAASRLVAVTDNQGNSIRYTLDAMGNRTHEEINDASSSLQSLIARVEADRNPLPRPVAA